MPVLQTKENNFTVEDYFNTSEDDRVELINGVFYDMASPGLSHQTISGELFVSIHDYIKNNGRECRVFAAPFDVQPDENDDTTIVVPDISVICDKSKLTERGCVGAPDWVIEITSPSNAGQDYLKKMNIYRKSGVRLYWIVDPMEESIAVYDFSKELPVPDAYSFDDKVNVAIYEGFSIDFAEIKRELPE